MAIFFTLLVTTLAGLASHTDIFEDDPYAFSQNHETVEACTIAIHGTDDICTTGEGSIAQYVVERGTQTQENTGPLEWVECSHWLGCFLAKEEKND